MTDTPREPRRPGVRLTDDMRQRIAAQNALVRSASPRDAERGTAMSDKIIGDPVRRWDYERGVADERARVEKIVKSLFVEDADEGPYLDALRDVFSALFLAESSADASPGVSP